MIPNERFNSRLSFPDCEALAAFDRGARYLMLEWHRRAHKTTLAINVLIREACKNAKAKYVYIAPTQIWARRMVWDDPTMIWDALPVKGEIGWTANEQKMMITFGNGSIIQICGGDDPDTERGIDAAGVVFDEWALHKPSLWGQTFRPIMAGDKDKHWTHDRWAIFCYTPKGDNFATQMFNIAACVESEGQLPIKGKAAKCKPEWFASRLIADESRIISREELDKMLQEVADGTMLLSDYEQEMQCRRVRDEERTLITSSQLEKLNTVIWDSINAANPQIRKIVAVDPAFGGDACCIKGFVNSKVVEERTCHFTLTSEVVAEVKLVAKIIETKNIIVDCIGNGKGVADGLAVDVAEYKVQYFNSSGSFEDEVDGKKKLFANCKAQAVFYASTLIRQCKVEPVQDIETRRQLIALSRYKVTNSGKTIMLPNDEVKKQIGCSPDKGLCWIYGIWGLQFVSSEIKPENESRRSRQKDPMLM